MGPEKQLALVRELGKAFQIDEAISVKVRRQTLQRLLGEEDGPVLGYLEVLLQRSSDEGIECHVQKLASEIQEETVERF